MNPFWPRFRENWVFATLLTVLLVVFVVFFGVRTFNAVKEGKEIGRAPDEHNTITIEGEGKVSGKPTLALVDVGLSSEGPKVADIQAQNSKKVNDIVVALKMLGIAEADLQTSNYSIYPKYEYKDGTQNIVGYTVSQNLNVKVRDLSKVGDVLAKAGQLGANQVNGVNFTIDDPTELKQQARKKAIADARAKAEELAEALDVDVTRVVNFSEASDAPYPMPMYAKAEALSLGGGGPVAPSIQSGSLDVNSRVSVTFEIR